MKQLLPSFFLFFSGSLCAQSFVNGSFETTSAPMSCQYNLTNASFNTMMSSVRGYGLGEELDIIINGCYNPAIPDGVRAVGIADSPSDEIAIPVTPALVAGQTYSFTFRAYAELSFRVRGDIQIGASTSAAAFGTLIFTGVTNASAWKQFTVNFTAPVNATHITVRNIPDGVIHWNHVDDFRFTPLLPVHIQRFDAYRKDRAVELNWMTQSEENNDFFNVERSIDGIEWVKIGMVRGAGSSNLVHESEFTDIAPLSGLNYYRLGQTDFDGSVTYSEIKVVEFEDEDDSGLVVYPNPFDDVLQIRFDQPQSIDKISIIDASGRVVCRFLADMYSIDLKHLPGGFYFLQIDLSDGRRLTRKAIKNR